MPDKINGVNVNDALKLAEKFVPKLERSEVAIAAPDEGAGFWAGAPSAAQDDGTIYLSYRMRQPVELGRGQGVVVAKSKDGVNFETILTIPKDAMDAESLERPTIVKIRDGLWRLYLSCATTGTKHWRVEIIDAARPEDFDPANRRPLLRGSKKWAVKDTVISKHNGQWDLWATFHPLDIEHEEDRMISRYASSTDGLKWHWALSDALKPRDGSWDSRGARVTAIHRDNGIVLAFYDGRASAAENYEERTGLAVGTEPYMLEAFGDHPFAESPNHTALRYLDLLPLSNGNHRLYYELAKDDGSHELRTELIK